MEFVNFPPDEALRVRTAEFHAKVKDEKKIAPRLKESNRSNGIRFMRYLFLLGADHRTG